MNKEEKNYLDLLKNILDNGSEVSDRTGVGTKTIFGSQLRFSLKDNKIPFLTTKKLFIRGVIEELLFFIRGERDTKKLEAKGINIWKGNTSREYLDKRKLTYLPEGDMGKGYGVQWRNFNGDDKYDDEWKRAHEPTFIGTDQLKEVLSSLKNDPYSRRHIITAWNPNQLKDTALAPCHIMVQFNVDKEGLLSSQFYMRSVDTFLGLPFNIASYAILTKIIAQTLGMKTKELIFVGGDTHIYSNHYEQVKEQIQRESFEFPELHIEKDLSSLLDIESLQFEDFKVNNYKSHPAIKADMAV